MSTDASWLPDPAGAHQLRYWNGSAWTEHVSDSGAAAVDPPPPGLPAPSAAPPPPPPPPPAAPPATGAAPPTTGGSWKDKLKAAASQATAQGKAMADQAKTAVGDQQAKRTQQWADDPNTLWVGESKTVGSGVTGAKARYRVTKDRLWIESGLLGTKSEQVPLWSIADIDVRQSVMNQTKDIGDLVLHLDDATYSVDPTSAFSLSGMGGGGRAHGGTVTLDNIEHPYQVYDLLQPLISEARAKKLVERQTQYMHVNPVAMGVPMGTPAAPPAPSASPAPALDVADQVRKLAALRDEGLLTDEEFAAQKAKLLGT